MRPFNERPITDRSRELFGSYMKRYEYEPSMSPFDAAISERSRELYGQYRSRYSTQKVAVQECVATSLNGTNWVTLYLPAAKTLDINIYRMTFNYGAIAGTFLYRMLINDVKVYPFGSAASPADGATIYIGCTFVNIRAGDKGTFQIRSTNAGDVGAVFIDVDYVDYLSYV